MTARVEAPAKINLDLRILHRRPDGYHEIRTIFQTISLADEILIDFRPAPDTTIAIEGNVQIDDNLIARAARLILGETGVRGDLRFQLHKRIPMGAGLGGGSSDAAAVVKALPGLIGCNIPRERQLALAAGLGSDVPFFLFGGTAAGLGRGEELYPIAPPPPCSGLLVMPDIHVSTAEAYGALGAALDPSEAERKRSEFVQLTWTMDLTKAANDFEAVVFAMHPELGRIRNALAAAGAICARMTGSGSAVFGLFPDVLAASRAAEQFRDVHPCAPFDLLGRSRDS